MLFSCQYKYTNVGIFKKNQIAYWYAEHPRRLVKEAQSKSDMIKEIFPELESMIEKNSFQPEVRFLPDAYKFNSTMILMENHIALFSLKDGNVYAVTIASPTISNMFKQVFLFAWSMAVKSV
jgi:hypothetical protein